MLGRSYEGERVLRELNCCSIQVAWRLAHHHEVDRIVRQISDHQLAILNGQADLQPRTLTPEFRKQPGYEIFGRGGACDMDLAGAIALKTIHRLGGFTQPREDGAHMSGELLAGVREVHAPSHLFEQRKANVIFEQLELDRHRRLRQVELFGGAPEMQMPRRRFEGAQLFQSGVPHGLHLSI